MGDKKKILVIDDEPSVTYTISGFLKRMGPDYEMIQAFDKEKALAVIESEEPEVALVDIDLAGVSAGLEILEVINDRYKDKIKPIVITGHAKGYREQIEGIGCFEFFEKPVNLRELNNRIKDALGVGRVVEDRKGAVLDVTPKAKLLFIEPDVHTYAYLCSMLDNAKMTGAKYTIEVLRKEEGLLDMLMDYRPDIVLIGDTLMSEEQILAMADLIFNDIKIKPKSVIVHGLFERREQFEIELKRKGIKRCIQGEMDNEVLLKINRKLADFVAQECVDFGLVEE